MHDKRQPPNIVTAVSSTAMGLFALAGCFCAIKAGGPDFLAIAFIPVNLVLITLAILQWVFYFRTYVAFQIGELRDELQRNGSSPSLASPPAND